ncbi:MAG TPA: ABC transporter permease, partial [Vicinamibacteria bacterium]|nr:ABC transporter permease [Vicinamibacteria bacterium]
MTLGTPWRKALRDVWQERSRSALVVLAMAVGIAGFSTVLSSYAILTRELNDGYRASQPASFTLWTDGVDEALLREVCSAGHGVRLAEARRTVSGRIKTGPLAWRGLQLHVIPDFSAIQVSRVTPEHGAWPPGPGEILIERDALQVASAKVGDRVTVKTAGGAEQSLLVAGSVHDVGQAQARMENAVYGYVTPETLGRLGEGAYLDQVKVLVDGDPYDAAHVRSVAESLEQWLASHGHPVRRSEVPIPGAHPHAAIMGLLLLAMSSFGLFALLLSGILVVNLLTALMAAQVRQIGVMKAVGATRRQVAAVYLVQALALGAAALVVSLPIGLVGSQALCRYMAGFLNFDITTFRVPAWVYGLEVAVGLVVPVLAAARPVWRASALSVREALSEVGVSRSAFGANAFDRALAGVGGLSRPLLLALRNSVRRRA